MPFSIQLWVWVYISNGKTPVGFFVHFIVKWLLVAFNFLCNRRKPNTQEGSVHLKKIWKMLTFLNATFIPKNCVLFKIIVKSYKNLLQKKIQIVLKIEKNVLKMAHT